MKKGDLLFGIDPRPLQAELARAEADLARAKTKLELAKSDLARAEKLLQSKAISQQEYDQLTSGRQDSNSAVKAAQATVLTARPRQAPWAWLAPWPRNGVIMASGSTPWPRT